jgi:RHS repeat-associated protein/uncharacterized repeat protein (TIGR01451 family)
VSRLSRMRPSRRVVTVLVGVALLAPTVLRPETVLADPSVIPSGSGTIVIGPQAMEGNLQIHPGDPLKAGFDFTMPGSHPAAQVTIENGSVSIAVTCSNGTVPPPIALNLPTQTMAVTANSSAWYPSGSQSDPSVYQGSLAAPDLCAGGVMSAAAGATFRATVSSTDTTDALHFRFHYSDNTAGSWSATISVLPVPFAETLPSVQFTPALGLALAVDKASAIPGDTLTYTATLTDTGATLTLAGNLMVSNTSSATTTVASYWDELATSLNSSTWTPFAGTGASQPGYTPAVAPPITGGMSLTVVPVAASGVTYPAGPDLVLGTTIGAGSTALWHYTESIPLTPSQVGLLLNPTQVKRLRGSLHVEVNPPNPNVTQPAVMSLDFTQEFLGASPAPTGAISGATVSIQPPQGAAPLQFSASTTPGLASIAPGASVTVSGTSTVQAVAAKAANESDSIYLQRLAATEGSTLTASATASGTGWSGPVGSPSPAPTASTTEHLPIVSIAKSGPPTAGAGTTASYPLSLTNSGGAPANGLSISDSLPNGAAGTVSGLPAGLAAAANATATASYSIPGSQPAGSLADTAALTWQDANGNAYGPVSSSFTTTVTNTLSGATLTLAPQAAGPDVVGQSQTLTAALLNAGGSPIASQPLTFSVTGANPTTAQATTDASGKATFSYAGANPGVDQAQGTASAPGVTLQSNTSSVSWIKPIQTVSMTPVQGNFFHEPSTATTFVAKPGDTPDFSQTFPTIDFNPPAGTVPHNISGVTNQTRPFTDLTTDVGGNFNGTIVAQGNGVQAGVGTMSSFDAAFTGTVVAAEAGDVTFDLQVGDGFILGVGGGATRVSGDLTNPPASNTSVFQGYPLVAAYQAQSAAATRTATVHFPAPGTYPFELDYFECCAGDLSLTMTVAAIVPQTSPLSIYVGYADGLRPGGAAFPFPWIGSPGVTFVGDTAHVFDSGALRFDNSSAAAITLDSVTVDVGSNHFDLWPHGLTVPAQQTLVLAQTNNQNFDTSDFPIQCSANNGVIPVVNVTVAGVLTSFRDTHQVLNTGGIDPGGCGRNESTAWQRIAGVSAAINVPVPPAASLNLSPFSVPGATVGLAQRMTATAMDGQGLPVANLPLTVQVFGANTQQLSATTDASGVAAFSYVGTVPGADQVQVSGFVTGFRAVSNLATVTWTNPLQPGPNPQPSTGPPPSVTAVSPADGAVVTKPVPVTATITPPSGQTIASWQVTYQAQDPGPVVTLASGTGAPPSPLATFDPTLLRNDTYQISVTAVASNGVSETLTTTVTVFGNLKLGRYITTYQDMSVPVNGFQMEVRRRYDSIDKSQGDFGIGWRVDVVSFRTAPNRVLGAGGWSMFDTSCVFGLCLTAFKSSVPHYVSVTFPDQHTEIFDLTPQGGTNVFWTATAAYTARPGTGTTSTLAPVDGGALTYRGDGNLYDPSGQVYDPHQFKLTTLDGRVLILDPTTGLVSETDRSGNSLTIDGGGVHASNGPSITFTRDASGRITQITGPSAQTVGYSYSPADDLASSTDANGNQTTYSYDANHDLLSASGPGGRPLQGEQYDATGRLVAISDGAGDTVTMTNDVGAQRQVLLDPAGRMTTVLHFDDLGDVIQTDRIADGRTITSAATFDAVGHQLSETDETGHTQVQQYDAAGNVTSFKDANGTTFLLTYNGFGQVIAITDSAGDSIATYGYDAVGNLTSIHDVECTGCTNTYDAAGHVVTHTSPVNGTSRYTYDSAGRLVTIIDPEGNTFQQTSDASGRVTSITDPTGHVSRYVYDGLGNAVSQTDALGATRTASFDLNGHILTSTDPLGRTTTYSYDAAARLDHLVDRNGATVSFTYDANGRKLSETLPGGDVTTLTYDGFGRLTHTSNSSAVISIGYDDAGRVTSTTSTGTSGDPLPTATVTHTYDGIGDLLTSTAPDGTITNTYDQLGRVSTLTDASGGRFSFGFDADQRVSSLIRPNGVRDDLSYDAAGDVLSRSISLSGSPLATFSYTYTQNRARHSATDPSGTTTYTYNQLQALTGAVSPGAQEQYKYDAAGNRTSAQTPSGTVTASYGSDGRLVSDSRFAYAWDNEGNLVSRVDVATGATTKYTFNARRQLLAVQHPDGTATTYQYDPLGRRVSVSGGGTTTRYVYDGTNIRLEYDGANQLQASYTFGAGPDTPLEMRRGSTAYYYLEDGQGSVRALTDSTGAVVQSYTYDSYGNQHVVGSVPNPFSYTGREFDQASGLYYYRARYYDPASGRFISEDPSPALNPYPYAADDPVNATDPTGANTVEAALRFIMIGAVVGAISNGLATAIIECIHGCFDIRDVLIAALTGAVAGAVTNAVTLGFGCGWVCGAAVGGAVLGGSQDFLTQAVHRGLDHVDRGEVLGHMIYGATEGLAAGYFADGGYGIDMLTGNRFRSAYGFFVEDPQVLFPSVLNLLVGFNFNMVDAERSGGSACP